MADETKTQKASASASGNKEQVKKLEKDLKTAFKEERFGDVRKLADELKKIEPDNHVASRLLEKVEGAEAETLKRDNADKIKSLEVQMKEALKAGKLEVVDKLADEAIKLDPKNKMVKKIEKQIQKAKAVLDAQVKKEKIKGLTAEIKAPTKNKEWDKMAEKANELLTVEWENKAAMKALSAVAKEKKVEVKTLITASAPAETAKKPGFFGKLFGKKEEVEKVTSEKKEEIKPKDTAVTSGTAVETHGNASPKETVEKPATIKKEAEETEKDKIKSLEENLTLALKEERIKDAQVLIDDLKKIEPKNKTAKKAQVKLDKEKTELEAQAKKEKIKGLVDEMGAELKNEEWDKAAVKANELLALEWNHSAAIKGLKKVAKAKKVDHSTLITVKAPEKKPGFFAGLFGKKAAVETHRNASKDEGIVKPMIPAMPPKPEPVKPVVSQPPPVPALKPIALSPTPPKVEAPMPAPKPFTPPTPAKVPAAPMAAAPLGAVRPAAPKPMAKEAAPGKAPGQGNIFTKLFGKKAAAAKPGVEKPTESIIDTIVLQTEEDKKAKKKEKKKKESTGEGFIKFSGVFLRFSIVFILLSAGFFYVYNIDEENRLLTLAGQENYAIRLKNAADTLDDKRKDEMALSKEIQKYKEGYEDQNKVVIQNIIDGRLDWTDLIRKLNEVTEFIYEKNALAQYVQYNNYAYDVGTGRLTVSATLSDPLGKNLTKLAELEEAFIFYPKDKNNPEDDTLPYFYNMQEFKSFAKTFNKAIGRYISNFTLTLSTKEETNQ